LLADVVVVVVAVVVVVVIVIIFASRAVVLPVVSVVVLVVFALMAFFPLALLLVMLLPSPVIIGGAVHKFVLQSVLISFPLPLVAINGMCFISAGRHVARLMCDSLLLFGDYRHV